MLGKLHSGLFGWEYTQVGKGNRFNTISLTLICDFNQKFTSYLASYPGSCNDSFVFSNMQISQKPEYDQYMLAAYKGKELIDHQNFNFNYHLEQSQVTAKRHAQLPGGVRIKHAIGILKGFSSLHEM
ncbi:hypothetical protein VP01_143g3 [Puccinia sorghi]|uniref:DDE Tnp4 domain-containing protein n=1 Tax=Puccinia sorghi TaxID=27349 RepID=A0A0L6VK97_9BASI|nr:hypothetical protein VP01_143g3 [Puccinia sorghi]